jgi:hypothetical protein
MIIASACIFMDIQSSISQTLAGTYTSAQINGMDRNRSVKAG